MNFVGHIATGLRLDNGLDGPGFLVGTALPDFAGMGRVRLTRAAGSLGGGVALHHATDHAFHADEWFLELEAELRTTLRAGGLPDGAARACAHVGPELLLDGALFDDSAVARGVNAVYEQIATPGAEIIDLTTADERHRWSTHLSGIAEHLDPCAYRDPATVARRLHRITARRPRLAFGDALVDTVALHMSAVQPRIASSAVNVLDRVAGALAVTN